MEPHKGSSLWDRTRFFVRTRHRLRSGLLRLRSRWLQILQTGVAACVSWFLAVLLLGLEEPTFGTVTELDLAGAAGRAGTFGGSFLWETCVAVLELEGAIATSPVARLATGGVPYVVTLRGVRRLRGTTRDGA